MPRDVQEVVVPDVVVLPRLELRHRVRGDVELADELPGPFEEFLCSVLREKVGYDEVAACIDGVVRW